MTNEMEYLKKIATTIPNLKEGFVADSEHGKFDFYYLGKFQNDVVVLYNENIKEKFLGFKSNNIIGIEDG